MNQDFKRLLYVAVIGAVGALWIVFNDETYRYVGIAYIVALFVSLNLLFFKAK